MVQRELTGNSTDLLKVVLPAAARGDLNAVRSFLKADFDWVHAVGPHNRTMLWEAARKGRTDVVKLLLKKGADVDVAACFRTTRYSRDNFYAHSTRSSSPPLFMRPNRGRSGSGYRGGYNQRPRLSGSLGID